MKRLTWIVAAGMCLGAAFARGEEPVHPGDAPAASKGAPAAPAAVAAPAETSGVEEAVQEETRRGASSHTGVRKPLGPDELPDSLPGRWKVSLCVMVKPAHAWIRYENVETGEVRSISRFHLLVGGWYDKKEKQWNYGLTTKTGVYMDREQSIEHKYPQSRFLLLSSYVDNPKIYKGDHKGRGHGMAVNNCVTYTRDAWYFYTGEYYALTRFHEPSELRGAVLTHHPEVKSQTADDLAPPAADEAAPEVRGARKR